MHVDVLRTQAAERIGSRGAARYRNGAQQVPSYPGRAQPPGTATEGPVMSGLAVFGASATFSYLKSTGDCGVEVGARDLGEHCNSRCDNDADADGGRRLAQAEPERDRGGRSGVATSAPQMLGWCEQ